MTVHTFQFLPHGPQVFGEGNPPLAYVPPDGVRIPPQATVAGFIRTLLLQDSGEIDEAKAKEALEKIRVGGVFLADLSNSEKPALWVPLPADLRMSGAKDQAPTWHRARLEAKKTGEGTLGPMAADVEAPDLLVHVESKVGTEKTRSPKVLFRPLEKLIFWHLEESEGLGPDPQGSLRPLQTETRIHVALDSETGTAEAGALFGTGGVRFAEGFGLVADVIDEREQATPSSGRSLKGLGGRGRLGWASFTGGACFPSFGGDIEDRYKKRIAKLLTPHKVSCQSLGLGLQLLTPAFFGDIAWKPDWSQVGKALGLPGILTLRAACIDRYAFQSGWNLNKEIPRAVRRLVPAGSLYWLSLNSGGGDAQQKDLILNACQTLWGQSLCRALPDDLSNFLAAPAHDGYGVVLPFPCLLPDPEVP